jgi:hypothetical protein
MAFMQNPYADPSGFGTTFSPTPGQQDMAQIGSNLGTALFGSPQLAAAGALNRAQVGNLGAEQARTEQLTSDDATKQAAISNLGDVFGQTLRTANPDGSFRPATPDEVTQRMPQLIKGLSLATGGNGQDMGHVANVATAFLPSDYMTRAGALASGMPQAAAPDFAGTNARADQLTAQQNAQATSIEAQRAAAQVGAATGAASIDVAGRSKDQAAAEAFEVAHPTGDQATGAGRQALLDPNSPLSLSMAPAARLTAITDMVSPTYGRQTASMYATDARAAKGAQPPLNASIEKVFEHDLPSVAAGDSYDLSANAKTQFMARASQLYQMKAMPDGSPNPAFGNPAMAEKMTQAEFDGVPGGQSNIGSAFFGNNVYGTIPAGWGAGAQPGAAPAPAAQPQIGQPAPPVPTGQGLSGVSGLPPDAPPGAVMRGGQLWAPAPGGGWQQLARTGGGT